MILRKKDTNNVAVLHEYIKDRIELVYVNVYKEVCYFILTNLIVDYKKQVFITGINISMQYLICYIWPKEKKLVIWLLKLQIQQST